MAHLHEVRDTDPHFTIDQETMEITCASAVKPLKRGDHKTEKYSFRMPRYIEGHDMSLCNVVEVHYNNVKYDSTTRETKINSSFDEVEGFGISPDSEDAVTWSWLVKGDATQLDGNLDFCIRFACINGAEIEYQKFTEIYQSIPVGATIWNTEKVAMDYADVMQEWLEKVAENAGSTAKISEVELLAKNWVGDESPYSQVVSIDGVTKNSQVDLTPNVEQLDIFHHKDLTFVTENDGGIITVYAIGQKPTNDYTIQVTITEVSV